MIRMTLKLCIMSVLLVAALIQPAVAAKYLVYTGTYTRDATKGIYAFTFDPATGAMGPAELKAETSNPSWLAVHPNGKFLYSVNEDTDGMVTAFAMDPKTGALTKLNSVSSGGSVPCHLAIDKTGKLLLTANYGSGSVGVTAIGADGRLGETTRVQHKGSAEPHAHEIVFSKDNRFAFVPELGLNQVISYRVDPAKGSISPNDPPFVQLPTGNGPRHFAFHPNGKFAYGNNELSMTATAYTYDAARGELKEIQTLSTLPGGLKAGEGLSTSEAEVDRNGKFLYVGNRGHNSIAVFAIGGDGKLTAVEQAPTLGKTPRSFKIDPTGKYLLAGNQDSNTVVEFRIDAKTGKLTPTGKTIEAGIPVCFVFVPAK